MSVRSIYLRREECTNLQPDSFVDSADLLHDRSPLRHTAGDVTVGWHRRTSWRAMMGSMRMKTTWGRWLRMTCHQNIRSWMGCGCCLMDGDGEKRKGM